VTADISIDPFIVDHRATLQFVTASSHASRFAAASFRSASLT
jgi:hypothetical protein